MSDISHILATPPQTSPRKTALPVRPRSRNGRSDRRSKSPNGRVLTPDSSLPIASTDSRYLSPPNAIEFGRSGEKDYPFTFRALHNTTPLPPSPEPASVNLASSSTDQTQSNSTSLPPQSTAIERLLDLTSGLSIHSRTAPNDVITNETTNRTHVAYDVRDEIPPPQPYFHPTFQTAFQNGLGIAKSALAVIEKVADSSVTQGDLERLLKDAGDLSAFECTDTRTIALLGDSGQGKSSPINSLLHFPEIAKTGDIGAACTSVVTEYRHKTKNHTAPITIEVEYLSNPEIEELIRELLWNYRQVFLPEVDQDSVNAQDHARYLRESDQAWSALEAAFKHQREFSRAFLENQSEGALETITQRLIQWAREINWPEGGNAGKWKSTAATAEECCTKTSVFMNDRFWPFTKIIRVYLSAQVLKTGIVLADLPGLQDTNLARVRATQMYLMKCNHVFVVANISRAITDQSLKSSLYDVLARHVPLEWEESGGKSLRVSVVCTKSEDIKEKTARREFCGVDKKISLSEMEQLDKAIQDAKDSGDRDRKKEWKQKQQLLLMKARNKHVKDGLQTAYPSKVPGGLLKVFCVSNTMYEKYSNKGNSAMVKASQIPLLRRFCHSITADAQLLEAKNFLRSTLSSLLNSTKIWADCSSEDAQTSNSHTNGLVYENLQAAQEKIYKAIDELRERFIGVFQDVLSTLLEANRYEERERAARLESERWHSWHWSQYNAWCLNEGDNQTPRRGYVNWNAELIWKMRVELEYQWDLVEEEIPDVFRDLLPVMTAPLRSLKSLIRDQGLPNTLSEGVKFRIQDIEYKTGLVEQEFARDVKLVRRRSAEPNRSSYVVAEMTSAYRSAAQEGGTGKAARQRATVYGRITDGTMFPNISTRITETVDELTSASFQALHDKLQTVLDLIKDDLDMGLGPDIQDGSEEEREAKSDLIDEVERLKEKHEQVLDSISEY